jgi:uncharacterized protein YtpQ (UPF0354 family)
MSPRLTRFTVTLLSCLLLFSIDASADNSMLSPQQFTERFVTAARSAVPGLQISASKALELEVKASDGTVGTPSLGNAYSEYQRSPGSLDKVISTYVAVMKQTLSAKPAASAAGGDLDRVIPVIKGSEFVAVSTRQLEDLQARTGSKMHDAPIQEQLTKGLYIYYVFDLPDSVRFLTTSDMKRLNIPQTQLRTKAIDNLGRMMRSKIGVEQKGALYLLRADGNYEASLLLLDPIWKPENFRAKGDLVAYVLARDTVLITGAEEEDALRAAEAIAEKSDKLPYFISKNPYIRRNGAWSPF